MAWGIGSGDAVFVPDFTFFSSGEVVSAVGATPIFVDVCEDTFNIDYHKLEDMIAQIKEQGKLTPRAIVAVDLFGQPADYTEIRRIADENGLYILEDAAQAFGGNIEGKMVCSFGDISTTSFFPAKPLGCYGDGGAIFTDNDEWASLLKSYKVHGKGSNKYDNIRIGMNSRLDNLQAGVLLAKFPVFRDEEIDSTQRVAALYDDLLCDIVKIPVIREGYTSSWAQYTIRLESAEARDGLQAHLKAAGIPSMVYYQKPMHKQEAFGDYEYDDEQYVVSNKLSETVLSMPFHPYMSDEDVKLVAGAIKEYLN